MANMLHNFIQAIIKNDEYSLRFLLDNLYKAIHQRTGLNQYYEFRSGVTVSSIVNEVLFIRFYIYEPNFEIPVDLLNIINRYNDRQEYKLSRKELDTCCNCLKHYVVQCVHNRIKDEFKNDNINNNFSVSLDNEITEYLESNMENLDQFQVLSAIQKQEELEIIFEHIENVAGSNSNTQVYLLYLQGYQAKEICKMTDVTIEKIRNIIKKINKKIDPEMFDWLSID